MDYRAALDYLLGFTDWRKPVVHRPEAVLNVPRMRCLLDLCDAPDGRYGSAVIAGTKGKGSTAAMLAALLVAGGRRTGLYSQPHLHDYRERVRVDGASISPAALVALVETLAVTVQRLRERCPGLGEPSTYDLGTALALMHFASEDVDAAVLEVGLGGRYDAVNAVTPRVSLITSLSMDHMAVLGNTIEQIAAEKAGIIKPGVPVLVHPQIPAALAVLERVAAERKAPLMVSTEVVRVRPAAGRVDPRTGRQAIVVDIAAHFPARGVPRRSFDAALPLLGRFQRVNASSALAAALLQLDTNVGEEVLVTGLGAVRWPGRLEIVRREPLIIVDGAHNANSAAALRDALGETFPGAPLVFVLGTSLDKDIAGIIRELAPAAAAFVLTASTHPRSAPIERLASEAAAYGVPARRAASLDAALDQASQVAPKNGLICVTGSLFLVAEAREYFGLLDLESAAG